MKLTPLLFVGYLLVTRRFRAAATALATFAATVVLGFLVDPADSVTYWWHGTFAAADRISDVAGASNHSLSGLVARVPAPEAVYLVGGALLLAVTLALAVRAHRRGDEPLAVVLCGLCTAAVAPFSWSHHWVWVVPLALVLWRRRAWFLLACVLGSTAAVITAFPGPGVGPIPATGLISLAPDAYLVVFGLVLVVLRNDESPAGGPAGLSSGRSISR